MTGRLTIRPFRAEEAPDVAGWTYEPPYDLYDGDPSNPELYLTTDDEGFGYYAVVDAADEVVGFCCFGGEARVSGQEPVDGVVDIGGGVRPDLTSQGIATAVLPAVMAFATERFGARKFRTAVAAFNERSRRLCETAGFEIDREFDGPDRKFLQLIREASTPPKT